jgi:transcriptional regulator GlxA family with amidase domain
MDSVRSQGFVTITPGHSISNCPAPDVLVIPGGNIDNVLASPALLDWIRRVAGTARYTMSVCNGALVLSEAGLLKGKRATTHHGSIAALRQRLGVAQVVDDKRWVDNGSIGTAAGVSAGIDLSLHVVGRLLDPSAATRVARYMEYTWDPKAGVSAP